MPLSPGSTGFDEVIFREHAKNRSRKEDQTALSGIDKSAGFSLVTNKCLPILLQTLRERREHVVNSLKLLNMNFYSAGYK